MIRARLITIALGMAIAVPSNARALGPGGSTYDFCGSGLTLCASGNLSATHQAMGGYTVAMDVNRSLASNGRAAGVALWRAVHVSFDVSQTIRNAHLYVKSLEDESNDCIEGKPRIACVDFRDDDPPPVTATPEPGSMILVASGIAALGAYRRRKAADA